MSRSVKLSEVNEAAEECITKLVREEMHVCALTIITLPECDGMSMDFLFAQPSHGEYLEDITKEVSG
jgi:hypothetical protein